MGLAGSSAIVTAALRCLMDFYGVTAADVPRHRLPQLVLDVERAELGIQAGLQDRVVQVRRDRLVVNRAGHTGPCRTGETEQAGGEQSWTYRTVSYR